MITGNLGSALDFLEDILKRRQENTQDKVWHHIIELFLLIHIGLFSWVVFLNSDPWLFAFCSCCYKSSKDSSNVAVEPETDTLELLLVPLRPETL